MPPTGPAEGPPAHLRQERVLPLSHAGPVAPYRERMDTPDSAQPAPDFTAVAAAMAQVVEAAQRAAGDPSSWTLCPAPDGGQVMQFADPGDPRCAGGGTLVIGTLDVSAEALREFAQQDPAFPWETFPDGV